MALFHIILTKEKSRVERIIYYIIECESDNLFHRKIKCFLQSIKFISYRIDWKRING